MEVTEEFDYRAWLARYQADRAERFCAPAWEEFADAFGVSVPSPLRSLYLLGNSLQNTPVTLSGELGTLEIQGFTPLSSQSIAASQRYCGSFFEFAIGSSGESWLFSLDGSDQVYVDYQGDGSDIESLEIRFSSLLLWLSKSLPTTA